MPLYRADNILQRLAMRKRDNGGDSFCSSHLLFFFNRVNFRYLVLLARGVLLENASRKRDHLAASSLLIFSFESAKVALEGACPLRALLPRLSLARYEKAVVTL